MPQILPQFNPAGTGLESPHQRPTFGRSLLSGIGHGLERLAERKLHEITSRKALPGLEMLGFTRDQAERLLTLDPVMQQEIIREKMQEPSRNAYAKALHAAQDTSGFPAQFVGSSGYQQPMQEEVGAMGIQEAAPETQRPPMAKSIKQHYGESLLGMPQAQQQESAPESPAAISKITHPKEAQTLRLPLQQGVTSPQDIVARRAQQQESPKSFLEGSLNEKQLLEVSKLRAERDKAERVAIRHQYKETAGLLHELFEEKKHSRDKLEKLEQFQELTEKGQLDTPGYIEFLSNSGLDIPTLMSPDSEQFQKLQAEQLKDIGRTFKGSITNTEIHQYLKTIPSLLQSPEGRKRLIAMQKLEERAKIAYADTASKIISENRGVPPLDLEWAIDQRVGPALERLSIQFRKDLEKPVPKGQNKAITALQSIAGKAVGNLGNAALGATIGGRFAGVPGAIGGGLAGLSGISPKTFYPPK